MAKEQLLQSTITKWLRSKGCYVLKVQAGAGIPNGCPDIIAFYDGCYLMIEVKSSKTAKFQPLQKETIKKMQEWSSFVYVAYPDNWNTIKADLMARFF